MEFEIDFSPAPDYVVITTGGKATLEGFSNLLNELTSSPLWQKGTKQLIDHRQLELSHLTPDDIKMIQGIVQIFADRLGPGKCAFVMEGISGFLTGEYYAALSNTPHDSARAFSEMKPALYWLLIEE